jgi:hypothetical protein
MLRLQRERCSGKLLKIPLNVTVYKAEIYELVLIFIVDV